MELKLGGGVWGVRMCACGGGGMGRRYGEYPGGTKNAEKFPNAKLYV